MSNDMRTSSTIQSAIQRAFTLLVILPVLAFSQRAEAQFDFGFDGGGESEFNDSRDRVTPGILLSKTAVTPGSDVVVAVVLEIDNGWHLWPGPGPIGGGFAEFDGAIRTEIAVPADAVTPFALHTGFATWPEIHGATADLGDGPKDYGVFEGRVAILVPLTVDPSAAVGTYDVSLNLTFQTCDDQLCMAPVDMVVTGSLEIVATGGSGTSNEENPVFDAFDPTVFAKIRGGETAPEVIEFDVFGFAFTVDVAGGGGFLLLLLVAGIGGLFLNFTPCVLPVIPLKIMGLSAVADNRRRCFALGFSMSLGVVFFWMFLGGLIAGVKSFQSISQLFQYPIFTITVGVVIAVMAIGMAGFFTINLPNRFYAVQTRHDTLTGSFLFGIMTAVLSTPCTAPLMGAAAAWATTQSPGTVLIVFASIGTGMAVPYLILSAFPMLVKSMPRTGAASEVVKQVMGLLLLAAGIYFIGSGFAGLTIQPNEPPSRVYWWFVAAAGTAAGLWLLLKTFQLSKKAVPRIIFTVVGGFITTLSVLIGLTMTAKGPIDWVYYTPERFATAVAEDKVIVLDFTAEWCLNCKTLEATVLADDDVVAQLKRADVIPMKIDLTGDNPDGQAKLIEAGRRTIPLLVVYGRNGEEIWKSDAYTPSQVLEAIAEAEQRR
ncbi:MAG: thioredoxin family protein [Planctomycetota bacterium]|nr:thioredoxin family protein [Planctomycetota bacterium]